MKTVIKVRFCQNLSKFQGRIKELRRETMWVGGNSQPLRFTFYGNSNYCNNNLPKISYLLLKSNSYIAGKRKPFQDMTISQKRLFLFFGGILRFHCKHRRVITQGYKNAK